MKPNDKNNPLENRSAAALVSDIREIVQQARQQAYSAVNSAMVQAYWLIGRRIVEPIGTKKIRTVEPVKRVAL